MSIRQLWYIRRGDKITGPYPRQVIIDFLLIGRLGEQDLASSDQTKWTPLGEISDFTELLTVPTASTGEAVDWQLERLAAAKRWADERVMADRRLHEVSEEGERHGGDRRENPEMPEMAALRAIRAELHATPKPSSHAKLAWLAGGMLLLVLAGIWLLKPINPIKIDLSSGKPACNAAAAANVNWMGCDKAGASLSGMNLIGANLAKAKLNSAQMARVNLVYADLHQADLSFSDLSGAVLLGANLIKTNFSRADLRGADLTRADLRGAIFEEALLGGAVWPDGKVCAADSVGRCD